VLRTVLGILLLIIVVISASISFGGAVLVITNGVKAGLPYMLYGWLGLSISGLLIWRLTLKQKQGD